MSDAALKIKNDEDWGTPNTAGVSIASDLTFEEVGFKVGDAEIVKGVSIFAPSGSVTCLLGPSGSGKSTLLRIAAGMERPSEGRVLKDSKELCGPSRFVQPEHRGIGIVFQDYALFPHLTIGQNAAFGLAHLRRAQRLPHARHMLQRVGLDHRFDSYPHQLSGGEQQRVALARALAPRPGVLLMDEPFSGLDSRLRDTMREQTLGILRETRATSIIVTHDAEEALRMGDQIVLLRDGKVEQAGTGRDLYFRPKTLFAAGFFSELNRFEGKVEAGRVVTPLGPVPINGVSSGAPAVAAIRVNAISISAELDKQARATGRVLSARFAGDHDILQIGVHGHEMPIRVRIPAGSLGSEALNGQCDVFLNPKLNGSFAFAA
ncbi:MAG: ABC transporter ATP-binding protein [Ahrensia sp.]|nr:ABC transporter ATP-binding protein [Ahrensia sp.]